MSENDLCVVNWISPSSKKLKPVLSSVRSIRVALNDAAEMIKNFYITYDKAFLNVFDMNGDELAGTIIFNFNLTNDKLSSAIFGVSVVGEADLGHILIFFQSLKHGIIYYALATVYKENGKIVPQSVQSLKLPRLKGIFGNSKISSFVANNKFLVVSYYDQSVVLYNYKVFEGREIKILECKELNKPIRIIRRIFTKTNTKSRVYLPKNEYKIVFQLSSDFFLKLIPSENSKPPMQLKTKKILSKIKKSPPNCDLCLNKSEIYFLDGVCPNNESWVVVLASLAPFQLDNLYITLLKLAKKNTTISLKIICEFPITRFINPQTPNLILKSFYLSKTLKNSKNAKNGENEKNPKNTISFLFLNTSDGGHSIAQLDLSRLTNTQTRISAKNGPLLDAQTLLTPFDSTKNGPTEIRDFRLFCAALLPDIDPKTAKSVEKLKFFDLETLKCAAHSFYDSAKPPKNRVFSSKADFVLWLYKKSNKNAKNVKNKVRKRFWAEFIAKCDQIRDLDLTQRKIELVAPIFASEQEQSSGNETCSPNQNRPLFFLIGRSKVDLVLKTGPVPGSKKAIFAKFWQKIAQNKEFSAENGDNVIFSEFSKIKEIGFGDLCLCDGYGKNDFLKKVTNGDKYGPVCMGLIEKEVKEKAKFLRIFCEKWPKIGKNTKKDRTTHFLSILAKNFEILRFLIDFKLCGEENVSLFSKLISALNSEKNLIRNAFFSEFSVFSLISAQNGENPPIFDENKLFALFSVSMSLLEKSDKASKLWLLEYFLSFLIGDDNESLARNLLLFLSLGLKKKLKEAKTVADETFCAFNDEMSHSTKQRFCGNLKSFLILFAVDVLVDGSDNNSGFPSDPQWPAVGGVFGAFSFWKCFLSLFADHFEDKKCDFFLYFALKCIKSAGKDEINQTDMSRVVRRVVTLCAETRKFSTALHLVTSLDVDEVLVGNLVRAIYDSGDLSFLTIVPWGNASSKITKHLETLARRENDNVFSRRIYDHRKSQTLSAVFGPYGVLLAHSAAEKNTADLVAQYLWEIYKKLCANSNLSSLHRAQLITPVVFVLKRFLEKHGLAHLADASRADSPAAVAKNHVDRTFVLLLARYVLLHHGLAEPLSPLEAPALKQRRGRPLGPEPTAPSPHQSRARALAAALCSKGFVTLAFAVLKAFGEDLAPPFAEVAAKCLSVARASLLSARNDSALALAPRLELGADVGTRQSRLSWSLLQALLQRFDAEDKRYAKVVAGVLLRAAGGSGGVLAAGSGGVLAAGSGGGGVTFVPQFLFDAFKGGSGADGGDGKKGEIGKKGKSGGNGVGQRECFSARPDSVFLLRILVDNGYLVQAAEMAICYCRNERLWHLKHKKEVWYPAELIESLICKIETYLAENAASTEVPKNAETVNRLRVTLKTEFDLLNSIGTETKSDIEIV